jgi:CheY-like chemotaxis protein
MSPSIRILVVDDYKDWRDQVRSLLRARPEWQIICEVSGGSEAVQKAEELKPDLILLDIGLPKLNGIEAARRIRQLSPNSKIIFVSMETSPDVVQVALSTGAEGYVRKTDVHGDLLPAIEAVLQGKQFIGGKVKGYRLVGTPGAQTPYRHEVQFYSDDAFLLDGFTRFIADSLKAGNAAIVVVTKSHQASLLQRLKAEDVEIDSAIQQGTYISLDAADTPFTVMLNGLPDPDRFFECVNSLIKAASKAAKAEHPRVAFCSERAGLLWTEGKTDAAIRVEQLWNDLAKMHELDILCAYSLRSFEGAKDAFRSICAEHSAVYSD